MRREDRRITEDNEIVDILRSAEMGSIPILCHYTTDLSMKMES